MQGWGPPWPIFVVFAVVGMMIGSFAGAAAIRLSREEDVTVQRSHCDSCGRVLGVAELVPLISFIALRGRCRACGARIDRLQPLAEMSGAVIGLVAVCGGFDPRSAVLLAILGWQLLVLGLSDARSFYLPPVGIAVLALCALIVPLSVPSDVIVPVFLQQIMGGSLGFALLALPALAFRALRGKEGMGSADPALFAAIGLWLGPSGVCITLLLAATGGIVVAIALRILGRGAKTESESAPSESQVPESDAEAETGLPEGAVPLGALLCACGFLTAVAGFSTISTV